MAVQMKKNKWIRLLAYVTGLVNQDLLLQNDYLAAENRIRMHACLPDCACPIRNPCWPKLARTRRTALAQLACVAKPDTILAWYRKLIAHKFDGS